MLGPLRTLTASWLRFFSPAPQREKQEFIEAVAKWRDDYFDRQIKVYKITGDYADSLKNLIAKINTHILLSEKIADCPEKNLIIFLSSALNTSSFSPDEIKTATYFLLGLLIYFFYQERKIPKDLYNGVGKVLNLQDQKLDPYTTFRALEMLRLNFFSGLGDKTYQSQPYFRKVHLDSFRSSLDALIKNYADSPAGNILIRRYEAISFLNTLIIQSEVTLDVLYGSLLLMRTESGMPEIEKFLSIKTDQGAFYLQQLQNYFEKRPLFKNYFFNSKLSFNKALDDLIEIFSGSFERLEVPREGVDDFELLMMEEERPEIDLDSEEWDTLGEPQAESSLAPC